MKKDDDLAIPAFLRLTAEERFRERAKEAAISLAFDFARQRMYLGPAVAGPAMHDSYNDIKDLSKISEQSRFPRQ